MKTLKYPFETWMTAQARLRKKIGFRWSDRVTTKKVRLETFFFIFAKKKKKKKKMNNIFLPNKKRCGKKLFAAARLATITAPTGQETDFFCGQPHLRTKRLGMRDSNLSVLVLNSLNYSINTKSHDSTIPVICISSEVST